MENSVGWLSVCLACLASGCSDAPTTGAHLDLEVGPTADLPAPSVVAEDAQASPGTATQDDLLELTQDQPSDATPDEGSSDSLADPSDTSLADPSDDTQDAPIDEVETLRVGPGYELSFHEDDLYVSEGGRSALLLRTEEQGEISVADDAITVTHLEGCEDEVTRFTFNQLEARLVYGTALLAQAWGDHAEATELLIAAASLDHRFFSAAFSAATALIAQGELDEAIRILFYSSSGLHVYLMSVGDPSLLALAGHPWLAEMQADEAGTASLSVIDWGSQEGRPFLARSAEHRWLATLLFTSNVGCGLGDLDLTIWDELSLERLASIPLVADGDGDSCSPENREGYTIEGKLNVAARVVFANQFLSDMGFVLVPFEVGVMAEDTSGRRSFAFEGAALSLVVGQAGAVMLEHEGEVVDLMVPDHLAGHGADVVRGAILLPEQDIILLDCFEFRCEWTEEQWLARIPID